MGANNGKQYGSEGEWAASPHNSPVAPPSLPLALPSGKEESRTLPGRIPIWHPVWAVTFPSGSEYFGAPRMLSHRGGLSKQLPRLPLGRLELHFCLFLKPCASVSLPWASGVSDDGLAEGGRRF